MTSCEAPTACCTRGDKGRRAAAAFCWLLLLQMQLHLAGAARVATPASRGLLQAAAQDGSAGNLTFLAPYPAEFVAPDGEYTVVSTASEMLAAISAEGMASDGGTVSFVRISSDVKSVKVNLESRLEEGEAMVIDCQGAVIYWGDGELVASSRNGTVVPDTFVDMYHCIIFGPPSVQPGSASVRYNDCRILFPCGGEVCIP